MKEVCETGFQPVPDPYSEVANSKSNKKMSGKVLGFSIKTGSSTVSISYTDGDKRKRKDEEKKKTPRKLH